MSQDAMLIPATMRIACIAMGALGDRESSWLRDMHSTTDAEHVFIWLHHPPAAGGLSRDDSYTAEWKSLLPDLNKVRGMGGGHTHIPTHYDFEGMSGVRQPCAEE